jgi:hypothetical protein
MFARQFRHAQRELRVRDDLRAVVLEPGRCEALGERIPLAEAVASVELYERNAFGRIFRVQVEGEPEDVGVELAPQLLGNWLAEPAERSDVVAPDDDRMFGHSSMVPKPACHAEARWPIGRRFPTSAPMAVDARFVNVASLRTRSTSAA